MEPTANPKCVEVEDVAAVACAIQNMLLAARARGLAIEWSTGAPARSEHLKQFFGLTPGHQLLGFICLGCPDRADEPPKAQEPPP